jgi:ATP-binding cassette subfamily B (MDR/TAP) protein 1
VVTPRKIEPIVKPFSLSRVFKFTTPKQKFMLVVGTAGNIIAGGIVPSMAIFSG